MTFLHFSNFTLKRQVLSFDFFFFFFGSPYLAYLASPPKNPRFPTVSQACWGERGGNFRNLHCTVYSPGLLTWFATPLAWHKALRGRLNKVRDSTNLLARHFLGNELCAICRISKYDIYHLVDIFIQKWTQASM